MLLLHVRQRVLLLQRPRPRCLLLPRDLARRRPLLLPRRRRLVVLRLRRRWKRSILLLLWLLLLLILWRLGILLLLLLLWRRRLLRLHGGGGTLGRLQLQHACSVGNPEAQGAAGRGNQQLAGGELQAGVEVQEGCSPRHF